MDFSYSRSHFSWLPQAFSKGIINRLFQKVSYYSMVIDPVINVFSPNEVSSHFQICDHSIINFGKIGFCLGFSKTSHVESLDRFIKSMVEKVELEINNLMKQKHSKEEKQI